jgi:hypothetical protein
MSSGYLGNTNLKRIAEQIEFAPENLQEYVKCMKDPIYFAKQYIKIVHVDRGFIPLDMYDYQKEIVEKIINNRRLAVLTARQSGKCVCINTPIKLRNKKTGEMVETTIGEFYENEKRKAIAKNDADHAQKVYKEFD